MCGSHPCGKPLLDPDQVLFVRGQVAHLRPQRVECVLDDLPLREYRPCFDLRAARCERPRALVQRVPAFREPDRLRVQAPGGTEESELYFLRGCYYDPDNVRFIGRDLIEFDERYAYVDNDPTNWTDPSGMCAAKMPCPEILKRRGRDIVSACEKVEAVFSVTAAPARYCGEEFERWVSGMGECSQRLDLAIAVGAMVGAGGGGAFVGRAGSPAILGPTTLYIATAPGCALSAFARFTIAYGGIKLVEVAVKPWPVDQQGRVLSPREYREYFAMHDSGDLERKIVVGLVMWGANMLAVPIALRSGSLRARSFVGVTGFIVGAAIIYVGLVGRIPGVALVVFMEVIGSSLVFVYVASMPWASQDAATQFESEIA